MTGVAFWKERLTNHGPGGPLGGVEGSGWKLVYDENSFGTGSRRRSMKGSRSRRTTRSDLSLEATARFEIRSKE
jgi:hypothetical protein